MSFHYRHWDRSRQVNLQRQGVEYRLAEGRHQREEASLAAAGEGDGGQQRAVHARRLEGGDLLSRRALAARTGHPRCTDPNNCPTCSYSGTSCRR